MMFFQLSQLLSFLPFCPIIGMWAQWLDFESQVLANQS